MQFTVHWLETDSNGAKLHNDEDGNLPLRGGKTMVWEGGFREPGIVLLLSTAAHSSLLTCLGHQEWFAGPGKSRLAL